MSDEAKIRITSVEVDRVILPDSHPQPTVPWQPGKGAKTYGKVASAPNVGLSSSEGSVLMKAWFYLGLAGLIGSFIAWAVCEPFFSERSRSNTAGKVMFPLMVILMSFCFGIAESAIERSAKKAVQKGILSIILGTILGVGFYVLANFIYRFLWEAFGVLPDSSYQPSLWLSRSIAWAVFGVAGGIVYGVVDRSGRKCLYGVIGGALGAGIGGFLFDPISILTQGGAISRGVGMIILGAGTGLAIGLVESALKDRWLYVSGGPLAGKQFILYKAQTQMGSQQSADIYLFKDPAILPLHAFIELRGPQTVLHSVGQVFVSGQAVSSQLMLKSGDLIQIGNYTFSFFEKQQSR